MGFIKKATLAAEVAAARILRRRKPLIVAWSVTNRCNRDCLYCDSPDLGGPELTETQGLDLIGQIRQAGGRVLSFTGGEPLIHPSIEKYIERVRTLGMKCVLNTNGVLVRKKIDMLKGLSFLKMSLDGPPDIHDEIRGGKCAQYVFDALDVCKENGISATLLAVLSTKNLDQVPYLLQVARQYGITVAFQPATGHALKSDRDNPIVPEKSDYKKVIDEIIAAKKGAYKRYIGNSLAGLGHLRNWPEPTSMKCSGLMVSCRIEPDGRVYHCGRMIRCIKGFSAVELGFAESFNRLLDEECDFCWCAHRVETNLILDLSLSAGFEALKAKLF